jgi:hypothetical protein
VKWVLDGRKVSEPRLLGIPASGFSQSYRRWTNPLLPRLWRLSKGARLLSLLLVQEYRRRQEVRHPFTTCGIDANRRRVQDFRSWDGIFRASGKEVFEYNTLCSAEGLKRHNNAIGCLARLVMRAKLTVFYYMLAYLGQQRAQPLKRNYTQNVDGCETSFAILHTPVPLSRACERLNIQLHGNLRTTKCSVCNEIDELDPEQHINNTGLNFWSCMRINPERGNKRKRLAKCGQISSCMGTA